jgi:hypothetical protein
VATNPAEATVVPDNVKVEFESEIHPTLSFETSITTEADTAPVPETVAWYAAFRVSSAANSLDPPAIVTNVAGKSTIILLAIIYSSHSIIQGHNDHIYIFTSAIFVGRIVPSQLWVV